MNFIKYKGFIGRGKEEQDRIKEAIRVLEEAGLKVIIYDNFIALLIGSV